MLTRNLIADFKLSLPTDFDFIKTKLGENHSDEIFF